MRADLVAWVGKDLDGASASAHSVAAPNIRIGDDGKRIHAITAHRFDFHDTLLSRASVLSKPFYSRHTPLTIGPRSEFRLTTKASGHCYLLFMPQRYF